MVTAEYLQQDLLTSTQSSPHQHGTSQMESGGWGVEHCTALLEVEWGRRT